MAQHLPGRRGFLHTAGTALAASLVSPNLQAPSFRGANDVANEKLRLGFIGLGPRGSYHLRLVAGLPGFEIGALCDVYRPALERAAAWVRQAGFTGVRPVRNFRQIIADPSIDAVCIATPDHWHAYMTVEACKAGKDVYLEVPAFVYVEEGVKMVEAARRYGRVVQAGTVERSAPFLGKAREVVRRGGLGEIVYCRAFEAGPAAQTPFGHPPPSPELDWDLWLGPATRRPCSPDWGSGIVTAAGVRLLDMVRYVCGETMPLAVSAQGCRLYKKDSPGMPGTLLATYRFPGFVASYESRAVSPTRMGAGPGCAAFHGAGATLVIGRGGYAISSAARALRTAQERTETGAATRLHWQNFRECIRTRTRPVSDIETVVRSTAACVLTNLALQHGTALEWDDAGFTVRQKEVRPLLRATYRPPWKLEV